MLIGNVAYLSVTGKVIWKRLLIDGDGAGDNQSINVLLKNFTKWCNSTGFPEEDYM